MWIEREKKKAEFIKAVSTLKNQVLICRGARQVGKTSFILNALKGMEGFHQIKINLTLKSQGQVYGEDHFGRDFLGLDPAGEELLKNISFIAGNKTKPVILFIDEADQFPHSLEMIQNLAGHSDRLKVIITGSNLENIIVKNAATGRKRFFDLYPVTFREFLTAYDKSAEGAYLDSISPKEKIFSEHFHQSLLSLFQIYLRLGGMPKTLDTFINPADNGQSIPQLVSDLVTTIEDNIKTVLGGKYSLYEYEDILRKLALLSMETLKISRLQVQHTSRAEAKKLVNKTVGARVAHKIRLYESGTDLSKYIIFDAGVLNYLLNGSDLLLQQIPTQHLAIQYETTVGNEIISGLTHRDDLYYWKSERGAQVEFFLRSPVFVAIDVKSTKGNLKSLHSCVLFEEEVRCLVKVSQDQPQWVFQHEAKLPNFEKSCQVPLMVVPHYLSGRIPDLCKEFLG